MQHMKRGALLILLATGLLGARTAEAQPGQPTNPRIDISPDGTTLTASWVPAPGSGSGVVFEVEFRSLPSGAVVAVAHTAANSLTANIPRGATGTFRFLVRGLLGGTAGPYSQAVDFTLGGNPSCLTPPNLRYTAQGDNLVFSWDPVAGATDYEIQAGAGSGGTDIFAGRIGFRTSISARVSAGFSAYVRLYAIGPCGRSAVSNEVRVAPGCPATGIGTRWEGSTSQGYPFAMEIANDVVTRVEFEAVGMSADPVCNNASTSTAVNISAPISNPDGSNPTFMGLDDNRFVRFVIRGELTAAGSPFRWTGTANGTLQVTLRSYSGPFLRCEAVANVTWGACRR